MVYFLLFICIFIVFLQGKLIYFMSYIRRLHHPIPFVDDSKSAYLFRGIKYTYSVQRTLTSTIYIDRLNV